MKSVTVRTDDGDYDILLGNRMLDQFDFAKLADQYDAIGFIVSERVLQLYESILHKISHGISARIYPMSDGEEHKNYRYAENFFNRLLKDGFTRKSLLIGVGGGVVGDFAGFLAAGYMRGIPLIHVPTTLLAMVDSSIGGKVAVNIEAGKNIVGAFHQPRNVIADTRFLNTLPDAEIQNGIAETIKHAVIGESRLLPILQQHELHSIRDDEAIEELIFLSASFKAMVVSQDVREAELRAILNFGHTVGHALESWMHYTNISHGMAVALGMKAEAEISNRMGFLRENEMALLNELLLRYGFLATSLSFDPAGVLAHMKFDKKNVKDSLRFVLLKKIGEPLYNIPVEESLVFDVLKKISG